MIYATNFYLEESYREALDEQANGLATMGQAVKEYARNAGSDRPNQEWILSPWDSWERNPCYRGPVGRHPEDDSPATADEINVMFQVAAVETRGY